MRILSIIIVGILKIVAIFAAAIILILVLRKIVINIRIEKSERAVSERNNKINSMSGLAAKICQNLINEFIGSSVVNEIVSQIRNDCGDKPFRVTVGNDFVKAEGPKGSSYYDFIAHGVLPISGMRFKCQNKITPEASQYIQWGQGIEDINSGKIVIRTLTIFAQAICCLLSDSDRRCYALNDLACCEKIYDDDRNLFYCVYNPQKPICLTLLPTRGI